MFDGAVALFGAVVVFGADVTLGRAIGVPILGPSAFGGGVRVSCLLGVKVVAVVLFSGFFTVLPLVWALGAMFSLCRSRGCWVKKKIHLPLWELDGAFKVGFLSLTCAGVP